MKNKAKYMLAALAALLIIGGSIKPAMAYFTTFVDAEGGKKIVLSNQTEITEPDPIVENWRKHVVITSKEGSADVAIRAKAYAGKEFTLEYSGEGWTAGDDGYYYYDKAIKGGESTSELLVQIGNIPEVKEGEEGAFNVTVVYESVLAVYDEEGNLAADWTSPAITKEEYKK